MKTTSFGIDSPRKRIFSILFVIGVVAAAVAIGAVLLRIYDNPVHDIDVTTLQRVTIYNPLTSVTKEVEPQRWSTLVNYFNSSSYAVNTTKWTDLASIEFHFKDGRQQKVVVYDTGKDLGCFSVDGVYFNGGDERVLIRMMDDEFRNQKRDRNSPMQKR